MAPRCPYCGNTDVHTMETYYEDEQDWGYDPQTMRCPRVLPVGQADSWGDVSDGTFICDAAWDPSDPSEVADR